MPGLVGLWLEGVTPVKWFIIATVFVVVVVWYGWHSTHNELTKKIDRESDPEIRSELIKLQGQIDRGRAGC